MKIMRKQKSQKESPPGSSKENENEEKLEMLRRNNSCLARALADQKIETNNWYTEAITLRGQLFELREKQIKEPAIMNIENVFGETEKQVKEYYDSIEVDFNSALDRLVKVVEKLAKVKQLVLGSRTTLQNCTQEIPSIFPRSSGSRVTLSSGGVNNAPRQRAVPPMVGGHVLQPVMVPLNKLKIDWNGGRRNHILVGEDNERNMSIIGEQASPENIDVSEEQQSLDVEDDQLEHDVTVVPDDDSPEPPSQDQPGLETRLSEDRPRRYNLREKTLSPLEQQTPSPLEGKVSNRGQKSPRRGRRPRREQGFLSRRSRSPAADSPEQMREGQEFHTLVLDDPLEGPSWLLDVGKSRFYSRRVRKSRKQKRGKSSSVIALDSSDDESDGVEVSPSLNGGLQGSRSRKRVSALATAPTDSPPLSLDHSCLESPYSKQARLESLEGAGGQRSKRHRKRKSVRSGNLEIEDLEQDDQIDQGAVPNTRSPVPAVGTLTEVDSVTDNNKGPSSNTPPSLSSESSLALQENVDITCNNVTNMDLTLPISDFVIQENPPVIQENPQTCIERNVDCLQDELKVTLSKRKFFKTKGMELSEEIPVPSEKTPYDLSMNETLVDLPPFSSTRTTEKENLPPVSPPVSAKRLSLCDVSVVLKDVMKQPEYSKTPRELTSSPWKESQSAKCISSNTPRQLRSVRRKTLQYTTNCEDNEEIETPKRPRRTRRDNKFTSSLNNKSKRARSSKILIDDEVIDSGLLESEDTALIGKNFEKCIVLLNRTPTMESCTSSEVEPQEVVSNIHQQEQPFEEMERSQECNENVETPSDLFPDLFPERQQDNSRGETETDTDFIEEIGEGNTQTGIQNDDPGNDCIVLEDSDDDDIKAAQGTCQEETNNEQPRTTDGPNISFEGFQSSETAKNSRNYQINSFFNHSEKGNPDQDSSDNSSTAGVPSGDCGRRRRAALKISSFKEVSLSRKMRRGDNNEIVIADSRKSNGRSQSRGCGVKKQKRGRSSAAGKAAEAEESS